MSHDPDGPFHEGKVPDAVIRTVEERDGVKLSDLRNPDSEKNAVPIDPPCKLGDVLVAPEHTGIEAFPDQVRLNIEAAKLFDPVIAQLEGFARRDECIQLLVPIDATTALKGTRISDVQDVRLAGVMETAPMLPQSRYPRHLLPIIEVTPPCVPFGSPLHRFIDCGPMGGRTYYVRLTPFGEQERHDRLCQTRDKKFRKLAEWKNQTGARTVLVLEDADI